MLTVLFNDILGLFRAMFYLVVAREFEGGSSEGLGRFVYVSDVVNHFYLDVVCYHALIVA